MISNSSQICRNNNTSSSLTKIDDSTPSSALKKTKAIYEKSAPQLPLAKGENLESAFEIIKKEDLKDIESIEAETKSKKDELARGIEEGGLSSAAIQKLERDILYGEWGAKVLKESLT